MRKLFWNSKKSEVTLLVILFSAFLGIHFWVNLQKFFIFHQSSIGLEQSGHMYWHLVHTGTMKLFSVPDHFPMSIASIFIAPINYFFFLFYLIAPYPYGLLFAQTLIAASSLFPVFLLSTTLLKDKFLAFAVTLSLFFHPMIGICATSGFLPQSSALPFLLWQLYFFEKRSFRWFVVFVLLALMVKPHIAVANIIFSLVLFFILKKKDFYREAKALLFLSCGWLLFASVGLWATLKIHDAHFYFPKSCVYQYDTLGDMFMDILRHPTIFFNYLGLHSKYYFFLFCLFFPVLFLPFFGAIYLLPIMPALVYLILFLESTEVFNVLAFTYYAGIYGLSRFHARSSRYVLAVLLIVASLSARYFLRPPFQDPNFSGSLPFSSTFSFKEYVQTDHHRLGLKLISRIEEGTRCLATPDVLLAHLGHCRSLGVFTNPDVNYKDGEWDYIIIDFNSLRYTTADPEQVRERAHSLVEEGLYTVLHKEDGWLLLRHKVYGTKDAPVENYER